MRSAKTFPLLALLLAGTALAGSAAAQGIAPNTQPGNGAFVAGNGSITRTPDTTTVTQTTSRGVVQWPTLSLGSQQTLRFDQQAGAQSWTLNRVTGGDPSVIAGRITANGGIAIVNQSGVVFTEGAQVNVGSLIASAANITNDNFMAGRLTFDGAPRPGARVENRGTITVADQGIAALVGPEVANSGTINARLGRVALAGAETFTLDLAGDGLLSIDVTQAVRAAPGGGAAVVTNSGTIQADGGSVLLSASAAAGLVETLVANTGTIQANTVGARTGQVALQATGGGTRTSGAILATGGAGQRGGNIEVNATGQVTVASGAVVDASGGAGGGKVTLGAAIASQPGAPRSLARRTVVEQGAAVRANATGNGDGGLVIVNAAERTDMQGTISALGGPGGGNGGFVELSSRGGFLIGGTVATLAPAGRGGTLLIDPDEIYIFYQVGITTSNATQQSISEASLNTLGLTNPNLVLSAVNRLWVGYTLVGSGPTLTAQPSTGTVTYTSGNLTLQTTGANATLNIDQPLVVTNGNLTLQSLAAGAVININQPLTVSGGSVLLESLNNTLSFATGIQILNDIRAATGVTVTGDSSFINHLTGATLATSSGNITFTGTGGTYMSLTGNLSTPGDITITGSGTTLVGLGGNVSANSLTIVSPRFETETPAPSVLVNRGVLISSPSLTFNSFGTTNTLTVDSLCGCSLPTVVLDGRGSGLTSLPSFIQAASTGFSAASQLAVLQQFGTPVSTAASAIALSVNAGSSPVFILADGAAVSGSLTAGWAGLFGTGGSASVTGSLGGLSGTTAATLAQTLIGKTSPLLQRYLFNGAVWQGIDDSRPVLNPVTTTNDTATTTGQGGGVSTLYGTQATLAQPSGTAALDALEVQADQPGANAFTSRFDGLLRPVQEQPPSRNTADPELEMPNAGGRDF